ncbi:MAG: hypothetical protein GXO35_07070, partial [Gammaproteobacteria bacterium]|nr:hypothetical protein [Gammaproteobacteria bacterium]
HESGFWQGVERLFQFDLSRSLMHYDLVYAQIAAFSPLRIPSLFSSGEGSVALDGAEFSGFLITEFLEGQVIDESTVSVSMVQQLTAHVVCLHRVKQSRFGALFNVEEVLGEQVRASTDWLHQLSGFLIEQGEMQGLSGTAWFGDALSALECIDEVSFSPIMLDLRWDQFLVNALGELSLPDLDAFVWGPRALELVMIEYLLDAQQATIFKLAYEEALGCIDIDAVRPVYRMVLFLLNVMGEKEVDKWMSHPCRF